MKVNSGKKKVDKILIPEKETRLFTVIICFYRCKYVIILEQDSPLNNIVNNLCILIIIELKKGIFNEK